MKIISSSLCSLQAIRACQDLPLVSAWLQHMLSTSSVLSSSSGSSRQHRSLQTQAGSSSTQPEGENEQQHQQNGGHAIDPANRWKHMQRYSFSIRPSVLSPLHALHREAEEVEQRMEFLDTTMKAHLKLADEIHPDELAAHSSSPDPVAAALNARRVQLQAVKDSYDKHMHESLTPCYDQVHMAGYYTVLEKALQQKDHDAVEFQKVLEGDRSVWDYWFKHFSPQYAGLPSLGSIEKIYNQADEEVMLREMARLRSSGPKPPPQPKVDRQGRARAVGGRKTSTAQVFVWCGKGRILVNRKPLDAYFGDLLMRSAVLRPLAATGLVDKVDVLVQVDGGGVSGQAQAAAHGIAKALRRLDPTLKPALKSAGLLKRDPRMVERKKPGKAKARKSFAWVKR